MAVPRVFLSSTCYDLAQIRDSLAEFISGYCYEPMLSDKGDIFYHPDLHTHESCVNEIDNCQLFVLIIGGRFGGNYSLDKTKSIVNAEYEAARIKKIPVFTFIKREVYEDHRVYQRNKNDKNLIKKIIFPSIENQEYAANIFEFINQVRLSDVNNGFTSFEYVKDIKQYLGKQWAGMMFDFLRDRSKSDTQKVVRNTLDNLTLLNKKTEELLESIVRKLNPDEANEQIENLDKIVAGSKFYKHIQNMYAKGSRTPDFPEKLALIDPKGLRWYEYIANVEGFEIEEFEEYNKITHFNTKLYLNFGSIGWSVLTENDIYPKEVEKAQILFEDLKKLTQIERERAIKFTTQQ